MKRRHFLRILGGGTIISAAALGGFALTRTPEKALEPWIMAGQYEDPRKFALSYAILAPNPHNRQPWMIDLSRSGSIYVYRDKHKDLPHTDPFDRQLTIGMGCFLELLAIAASARGYQANMRYFPDGEDGAVAHVTLEEGIAADALFPHILARRSCKEPFTDKPLTPAQKQALSRFGAVIDEPQKIDRLRKISIDAFDVEYETPRTMKESADLMRFGKAEINASPDGIDLGGAMLEILQLTGQITRETVQDPQHTAYKQGLDMYHTMLAATQNYILLKTKENNRYAQIEAGRKWARINLTTTQMGLSLHPISQALQEYEEMKPHYDAIHQEFAPDGETIQMLGRIGYGPQIAASPRWHLEKKLVG